RPSFSELSPDFEGVKLLAKLAFTKVSDDVIFRAIIEEIEKRGYRVISVQEAVPEILFHEGIYGSVTPTEQDMSDIERGITVAKALGTVDVGQSVVVQEGMVLAVEAIEGTDMLLSRAATVKRKGKDPVMVKIIKPGQETRVDFPVIGPATAEQLIKYGIKGLAVEAGGILIIQQRTVIEMANKAGIFIIGIKIND
ncbi:MAG: UDP-2,3-diacylglucosamine diphosphatase LpxI, partial [Candidatus Cloacimonetes bacterium]|nr:UDP-2,3-diacylglucosamine diphosphatase LpxI [Candidatus Cloacimonadota bacterium]